MITIGYLTLPTSKTFRQTFEVAAWYRDIRVEAGTYPIIRKDSPNPGCHPYLMVVMPGVVVGSYFPTLLCGNIVESIKDRDVGQPAEYSYELWESFVALKALGIRDDYPDFNITLAPGVSPTMKNVEGFILGELAYSKLTFNCN